MTTSGIETYIRLRSDILAENEPVSAGESVIVATNLLHLCDESAQVKVAWEGAMTLPTEYDTDQGPTSYNYESTSYYSIWTSGPVYHRVRPDGSIYPLRVRFAASAPTSKTLFFYVVLTGAPTDVAFRAAIAEGGSNVVEFTTSSSTPAWLGTDLITMDELDIADNNMQQQLVATREASGPPITVPVVAGYVGVMVTKITAGGDAELNGLNVAEFIG